MKKKYAVAAFLATLFFVFAVTMPVSAQPTADSFGVEDASGCSGAYVKVSVNVTNVTNGPVQSIRLRVDYNESVLNLTNVSNGNLTSAWTRQLGEDKQTVVIATAYTDRAISDGSSGSVVLLNFHVIGSSGDTSPMDMTLIELSNPDGKVGRTAPARNGIFTVTPSGEPTPIPPIPGGGRGGGGGYVPTTPTPTEKPAVAATPAPTEAPAAFPTLAPTITPSATSTQTPTSTSAPVLRLPPLFLILIAIAIIVIAGIIVVLRRNRS